MQRRHPLFLYRNLFQIGIQKTDHQFQIFCGLELRPAMRCAFERDVGDFVRANDCAEGIGQILILNGRDVAISGAVFNEEGRIISGDVIHRVGGCHQIGHSLNLCSNQF